MYVHILNSFRILRVATKAHPTPGKPRCSLCSALCNLWNPCSFNAISAWISQAVFRDCIACLLCNLRQAKGQLPQGHSKTSNVLDDVLEENGNCLRCKELIFVPVDIMPYHRTMHPASVAHGNRSWSVFKPDIGA